ncbi:MAG: radical SAM family heme chaperone HemW [Ruminococcaceae bacterium]|nr:radical SAM family heme chaperone HemW [Oscillospiraceae bacterium]
MTKPVGVYVHVPFCRKKCAYCDFYSAVLNGDTVGKYISALKEEIYRWGAKLCRPADTVYFGGGTPSVLSSEQLCDLLFFVKDAFFVTENAEITVEVNPETVDEEYLYKLKKAGFNRLSMGVQSFDDTSLKMLGRHHSAKQAQEVFKSARKVGFDNISIDIMLGLPAGNGGEETARKALELGAEHISCYMLILEEKTALFAQKDTLSLPDEERVSQEYKNVSLILKNGGYNQYEISNFSKDNKESRHNLKYWHTEEYIGIGPSAHSFINGERFYYERDLRNFINSPKTVSEGVGGDMYEYIMLALRLSEGICEDSLKKLYGKKFGGKFLDKADKFKNGGLATFKDGNFALTTDGMLLSNAIICEMTEEELYEDL